MSDKSEEGILSPRTRLWKAVHKKSVVPFFSLSPQQNRAAVDRKRICCRDETSGTSFSSGLSLFSIVEVNKKTNPPQEATSLEKFLARGGAVRRSPSTSPRANKKENAMPHPRQGHYSLGISDVAKGHDLGDLDADQQCIFNYKLKNRSPRPLLSKKVTETEENSLARSGSDHNKGRCGHYSAEVTCCEHDDQNCCVQKINDVPKLQKTKTLDKVVEGLSSSARNEGPSSPPANARDGCALSGTTTPVEVSKKALHDDSVPPTNGTKVNMDIMFKPSKDERDEWRVPLPGTPTLVP